MPLTFAETPLYYRDSQGQYHRILSGADMTAYRTSAAQDAIDAAQDADIASRSKADEIGIVITGARPSMVVSAGQYVIVRGSTITGITNGLYTAVNALSPSTDVTAADLTSVNSGGLNGLQNSFNSRFAPNVLSDLNTLGESAHPLMFATFNINTLNTPYKDGITNATAGTVFHMSASARYSCQMALSAGVSNIFIRHKADVNWSTWAKITPT